ncbi:MAG TPA: 2-oxoglutarate dehydrogenase E1 component [Kofleriaceae bacterium]|nr:2-oxoglutarate dehydrogenase E1 component [Kofleriaceae bacterium]
MSVDPVSLGQSMELLDEIYTQYRSDPDSVDPAWRELFLNGQAPETVAALARSVASLPATPDDPVAQRVEGPPPPAPRLEPAGAPALPALPPAPAVKPTPAGEHLFGIWPLVHAYRSFGHQAANLDPLGLLAVPETVELEPEHHGFTEEDLDREFPTGGLFGTTRATLREVLDRLRRTYSGSVGLESVHIQNPRKREWLNRRMERAANGAKPPAPIRRAMLEKLIGAETFERFCHTKFPGTKRFSLEGSETLIPMLEEVLNAAGRLGSIEAVVGMAHRGRLTVMVQTMQRRARDLFGEFQDIEPEATLGGGDVKYHLGYSCDREDRDGNAMHVSLAFNPSHLEAVDPVVVGRVRGKQRRHKDWVRRRILGILLHGDAAFAGQGLVAETLQLSNLHGYRTGGTVHLIVNNQIGFTASPQEARSTPYCTDMAMMIQCPIWHVNGEDLDAVYRVVEMAMEYRAQFQSDVVIDMFCYRKFGHNEMDEPSFTQPVMYRRIQQKQPIDAIYGAKLIEEGVLTAQDVAAVRARYRAEYERELELARAADKRPVISSFGGIWAGYLGGPAANVPDVATGVPAERLREVSERMNAIPDGINAHPKVKKLLDERLKMGRGERPLDWGMGEMLAYGTLLWDGHMVRLSGQDSCRGTFSHRHAMIVDVDTGTEHMGLGHLHQDQGECRIYDSPLSEAAVMGFEFGYSLDYPDGLVIWEAQFGDFANGAQVIIDQFIMSSEDKWHRLSGLVLLLPHGYEGQGPEHSSARVERFLQGAAEDNMLIVQPSTPAQMFHMLRRQVLRPLRKPLVVLTPKSLLRLPAASSRLEELTEGRFLRFIPDTDVVAEQVDRVILCSGRIYYDLVEERKTRKDERVAIVRIEQFYPWWPDELRAALAPYTGVRAIVWVQDEPANMGARQFILPRLADVFGHQSVAAVSRVESASPATGSHKAHQIEQRQIYDAAFARPATATATAATTAAATAAATD